MKVIFLDVDGVLNSDFSRKEIDKDEDWRMNEVSDWHIEKLKRVVDETGAKIVLSSSWRLSHPKITGYKEIRDPLYKILEKKLSNWGLEIIDVTPDFQAWKWRGHEVAAWLNEHPEVERYVIFDDDEDFLDEQQSFFVNTTFSNGLTEELADKAIIILKGKGNEE